MFARRWCAVLLILVCGVPRAIGAQQQERCVTSIPVNIDAGLLTPDVLALLRRSETFRAQCARIAQSRHVRIKLGMTAALDGARAQTVIHRFEAGAIAADVDFLFGENYRELLAHEFEHILEQIDGIDLRQEAAQGRAWLLPGGAFETRRAFTIGVQVMRELDPPRAQPARHAVQATR